MKRSVVALGGLLVTALILSAQAASAKGSASVTVSKTAAVTGTVVSGVITITNATQKPVTIKAIGDSLEVRYKDGVTPPPLVPSSTAGYYLVTTVDLPTPSSPIPALGTVTIPYSIDVCGKTVENYPGAKDMRNSVVVTVAVSGTQKAQVVLARSPNFPLPSKSACPVCGNGRVEIGELCDGGSCCTATCQPVANGATCSDGNACTLTDQCQSGSCVGSNPKTCTASDQCHIAGTCNPATGACSNPIKANGSTCDDANACSTGDICSNGQCRGAPIVCNDGNACTTDSCSDGACVFTNNSNPCNDGNGCTVGDTCSGGACASGAPRDCNDNQACTVDSCNEASGACTYAPTSTCGTCDASGCSTCKDACTTANAQCAQACWDGFFACLNGCTSTYCAPFCQVDLGACLGTCPVVTTCQTACEIGNGCAAGCIQP